MIKTTEQLKEQFMERYNQLKASELLIDASINLIYSIRSDEGPIIGIDEFISKIPEYNAYSEDANSVKQILQEVKECERELNVALAELNYLYDVSCYRQERVCLMSQEFKCYF